MIKQIFNISYKIEIPGKSSIKSHQVFSVMNNVHDFYVFTLFLNHVNNSR